MNWIEWIYHGTRPCDEDATAASGGATVYVAGAGGKGGREVTMCVLPSSNAANTRMTHDAKVNEWRSALLG